MLPKQLHVLKCTVAPVLTRRRSIKKFARLEVNNILAFEPWFLHGYENCALLGYYAVIICNFLPLLVA